MSDWKNRIVGYGVKPADQFAAHPNNPRRHPQPQRDAVRASLDTLGWIGVVIENVRTGYLIDGHERVMQALEDNVDVPYIQVDLSEDEEAQALLTFDWITQMAQYDRDALDGLLRSVNSDDAGVQALLAEIAEEHDLYPDPTPVEDAGAQIDRAEELLQVWQVERGQLWVIPSKSGNGEHRLLCGDSTNADDVARVMSGERADAVINDPPYGMRLDADFSDMKSNLKFAREKSAFGGRKYDNVIGDHSDYDASAVRSLFADTQEQFWFGADYYASTLGDTMHSGSWLVWDKRLDDSADLMFGSCFELVWSAQPHKRDILRIKWAGVFGVEQEPERQRFHPNHKPVALYHKLITRYVPVNGIVADCYGGAGSNAIACEQLGRQCRMIEIEPKYCAVILQRMKDMGLEPQLVK